MLKARTSIVSIIAAEVVLLALMIVGLLRWRVRGNGGLWQLLVTQVNLSLLAACIALIRSTEGCGVGCGYPCGRYSPIGAFI